MPRLSLGPLVAALAVVSVLLPSVAEAEVSGSQTFYPGEGEQSFVVPEGVHDLSVSARGASGVQIDTAGTAGLGAIASGTFGVTPGETLLIYVADGDSDGYAEGGAHGKVVGSPKDGGAGGGSSAVVPPSGGPFVIAGGGGGAGGDYHDTTGGAGGNAGTPFAEPGQPGRFMEDGEFIQENTHPGCGGCAGEEEGGDGDSDYDWVTSGGGGGGGGAGAEGGNGGEHGLDDGTDESGAGGGGGSSTIRSDAFAPSYAPASGCQGHPEPACEGLVTISWGAPGASVSPVTGSEQSRVLSGEFEPIAVRVTDAAGYPLEAVPVTFAAPTIGPSGTFPGGGPSLVAETDSNGVATLYGLGTKAPAGRWNLEASVPGGAVGHLPLENQPIPTDVALESTPDPSTAAETPVISAHVEPTIEVPGLMPTGSMQFEFEGVPAGEPVALDPSTGTATLPAASVPNFDAGKRAIDVHYLGDSSYSASEDGIVQTVLPEPTAIGVEGQPDPVSSGSPVTLRATIETRSSSVPPTGLVAFQSDGTALGSATVDGSGVATLQLGLLPLGTHTVVASYGGDARFAASTGEMSEVVDEAAVAAVLTSSSNPSTYGTPPRIEAQVQRAEPGPTPTGTIDFSVDGQVACAAVTLTAGSAGCDLTETVPAGKHVVTAAFVPAVGSQDKPTTGSMRQVVVASLTSDTLTATPKKAIFGAPFALASTVLRADGVAATGSVGYQLDGYATAAPVTLDSGVATLADGCAAPAPHPCPLGIGLHRVHSEFPGGGNFRPSRATAYVHVEPSPTTTAVHLAAAPSANSPASFVAAITAPDRQPEGRVQFLLDGVAFGAPVAIAAGTATSPPTAPLPPGVHQVVAHYLETELFDEYSHAAPAGRRAHHRRSSWGRRSPSPSPATR